jgi:transposase
MRSTKGQKRDQQALEARRLAALELLESGEKPAAIARKLKTTCQSVCRWRDAARAGGAKALRSGRVGRKPKVTDAQLEAVTAALVRGPRANGVAADLWTLPRVAKVIQRICGVRYGVSGVWYVLGRLGWSVQRPARQAKQRDQDQVDAWLKAGWRAVKKTPDARGE